MRRETTFLAVSPSMRLRIETTVENLLALLDEIDGDENIECGGDPEPEETDCNLAGAMSDLEHDEGEGDCNLFISGGSEKGTQVVWNGGQL